MTIKNYLLLTKPTILFFSLSTFFTAFALSSQLNNINWTQFTIILTGCAFLFAGSACVNQIMENKDDAKMARTQKRPIPSKNISIKKAIVFSIIWITIGEILLIKSTNQTVFILANLTIIIYNLIYTPTKKITWLNTYIGAIAGASPSLCGWYAHNQIFEINSLFLFILIIIWQLPHFYAIAWCYKEDYKIANFKMLSEQDQSGSKTLKHITFSTIALMIWSLTPLQTKLLNIPYLIGASLSGLLLLYCVMIFHKERTPKQAKKLMFQTLIYLLLIISFIFIDILI